MKFRKFQSSLAIDRDKCEKAEGRPICESEARESFWCVRDGIPCKRSGTCARLVLSGTRWTLASRRSRLDERDVLSRRVRSETDAAGSKCEWLPT